jgi:hypothetical protein
MSVLLWHKDELANPNEATITVGKVYQVEGWTFFEDFMQIRNDAGQLSWFKTFKFDNDLTRDPATFHVIDHKTHEFLTLAAGMRVHWKPTKTDGTILEICVDIDNPERCGIEAEIKWDNGQVMRYNAADFAKTGDIIPWAP